jgi:hypothetical protein
MRFNRILAKNTEGGKIPLNLINPINPNSQILLNLINPTNPNSKNQQ